MEPVRLGRSGLKVSPLCLGTMMFGGQTDAAEATRIIHAARDAGVNFIDTADAYHDGRSEHIVGEALRADRWHWVVASKAANPMPARPGSGGLSRRWLLQACDDSLGRLGVECIDVYYLHKDDWGTPVAETVAAIGDLIRAGKIRYFGVSNFRGWRIAEVTRWCDRLGVPAPVVCQPHYNLLNRTPEVEVLPACDHYGLGVAPYSPIARGVLTAKYPALDAAPPDSRAARKDARMLQTEFRQESIDIARTLQAHAAKTGRTPIGLALAWLWANPIVTSVIAGPRTLAQWADYVTAIGTPWGPADEALVDALVPPGHPSTPGHTDPSYPVDGRCRGRA